MSTPQAPDYGIEKVMRDHGFDLVEEDVVLDLDIPEDKPYPVYYQVWKLYDENDRERSEVWLRWIHPAASKARKKHWIDAQLMKNQRVIGRITVKGPRDARSFSRALAEAFGMT